MFANKSRIAVYIYGLILGIFHYCHRESDFMMIQLPIILDYQFYQRTPVSLFIAAFNTST